MNSLIDVKQNFLKAFAAAALVLIQDSKVEDDADVEAFDNLAYATSLLLSHEDVEHLFKGHAVLFSDACPHKTVSKTHPDYEYIGVTYDGFALAYYHPANPEDGFASDELTDLSAEDLYAVCENVKVMFA